VWPDCIQLLSHVLVATEHAERLAVEPAETSRLLNLTAGYLQGRGRYGEARELVERALALAEGTFGPEHKETGIRLNELGLLLLRTGDPAAARPYLERALAIYSAVLPPDDREVATTLDNLGQALRELGDLPGQANISIARWQSRSARSVPMTPPSASPFSISATSSTTKEISPVHANTMNVRWPSSGLRWALITRI
jgi:tetratricopeptide (TPR) repeat protein